MFFFFSCKLYCICVEQKEHSVKILPRMSRGGFNMWKIAPRASVCCGFGLVSTKDTTSLCPGSWVIKDFIDGVGGGVKAQFLSSSYFAFTCRPFFWVFFFSLFKVLQIWFEKFNHLKAFQQEGELISRHSVEGATFRWNAKTEPSCWVLFLNSQLTAASEEEPGCPERQDFQSPVMHLRKVWFGLVVGGWLVGGIYPELRIGCLERDSSQRMRKRWQSPNPWHPAGRSLLPAHAALKPWVPSALSLPARHFCFPLLFLPFHSLKHQCTYFRPVREESLLFCVSALYFP